MQTGRGLREGEEAGEAAVMIEELVASEGAFQRLLFRWLLHGNCHCSGHGLSSKEQPGGEHTRHGVREGTWGFRAGHCPRVFEFDNLKTFRACPLGLSWRCHYIGLIASPATGNSTSSPPPRHTGWKWD